MLIALFVKNLAVLIKGGVDIEDLNIIRATAKMTGYWTEDHEAQYHTYLEWRAANPAVVNCFHAAIASTPVEADQTPVAVSPLAPKPVELPAMLEMNQVVTPEPQFAPAVLAPAPKTPKGGKPAKKA